MKIVEEKKIQDFRSTNHVCTKCKSVLQIEEADLKVAGYMYPIGPTDTKLGFGYNCPICNCFNWIYQEDTIPDELKEKLLKEYKKANKGISLGLIFSGILILLAVMLFYYFSTK